MRRCTRKLAIAEKCCEQSVRKPEEEICSAIRQSATDRGEARRVFLLYRFVHAAAVTPGGERSCISAAVAESLWQLHGPSARRVRDKLRPFRQRRSAPAGDSDLAAGIAIRKEPRCVAS